jgi:hypothetical protein
MKKENAATCLVPGNGGVPFAEGWNGKARKRILAAKAPGSRDIV